MQFGAIIFCRTFKNYFGQFVWIEKKATIIVAFHFMKRRLKNQPHTLPQQVLVQQAPIIFCCYYKPPRSGPHQLFVSLVRVVVDNLKFSLKFSENLQKRPGHIGLTIRKNETQKVLVLKFSKCSQFFDFLRLVFL